MAKHTQGLWTASKVNIESDGRLLASAQHAHTDTAETAANLRLMATAPELLEALKDAKRWIELLPESIVGGSIMPDKLAHVIARAECRD